MHPYLDFLCSKTLSSLFGSWAGSCSHQPMWQQWLNDLFHFVSNHIEIQFIHILSCDFESNRIRDCEHLGLRQRLTTSETDQQWHWGSWQRWSVNCWRRVLSVNNRHLLADDFARGYTSMGSRALKSDATDLPHSSFDLLQPTLFRGTPKVDLMSTVWPPGPPKVS